MSADALNDAADQIADKPLRRKLSGKKLVLLILLPLLVLCGVGGALLTSGALDSLTSSDEQPAEPAEPIAGPGGYFYDLPDILVNLNTDGRRQSFLSISVSLELGSEADIAHVEKVLPRIIDNFQVYLRELQLDDLRGSAGLYRLREELLRRVGNAAHPADVRDVLFREMLVQ